MQKFNDRLKSIAKPQYMGWLLIALGIVLRLKQYLVNRSFWADESSLALNLVNRTFAGLAQPLDYEQASPILFLFIEKLLLVALGNKDYILRLFPLAAGLLAVFLIYRVASENIGTAGLFAVGLFSVSGYLVYYSSELKQYGSDVTLGLLLVFFSTACLREDARTKDFLLLGISGAIAIWASHTSIFILAGIGLAIGWQKLARRDFKSLAWILGMGLAWLISLAAEYFVSLQYITADTYLMTYWRKAFMPIPPWTRLGWFRDTYFSFVLFTLSRSDLFLALILLALAVTGAVSMLGRDRYFALILLSPFIMASVASALQRYPLKDRFMLFLAPYLFLLMAEGLRRIHALFAKWNRTIALLASAGLALVVIGLPAYDTFQTFLSPFADIGIRPVIQYVQSKRMPGDLVYVFHSAETGFKYYSPLYGLDQGQIIIGLNATQKKIALQGFLDDVNELKGNRRVWFVFSDITDCGGCTGDKQAFYVNYLDQFGTQLDRFSAQNANAYLYDLSP